MLYEVITVIIPALVGAVDDVQQQICLPGLLQCRLEGRHQVMRQMPDEADRIRQNGRPHFGQVDASEGRIQGRKQLIGSVDPGTGNVVEQGRSYNFV